MLGVNNDLRWLADEKVDALAFPNRSPKDGRVVRPGRKIRTRNQNRVHAMVGAYSY